MLLQELVKDGLVKGIGLSEVSAADIRKAHAVHPITAVELEWSLFVRDAEVTLFLLLCSKPELAVFLFFCLCLAGMTLCAFWICC